MLSAFARGGVGGQERDEIVEGLRSNALAFAGGAGKAGAEGVDEVDDFEHVVGTDVVVFDRVEEAERLAEDGVGWNGAGAEGVDVVDDRYCIAGDDVIVGRYVELVDIVVPRE